MRVKLYVTMLFFNIPMERVVLDKDIRYIDNNGNLLRSRAEFSISKLLSFLGITYEYDANLSFKDGTSAKIDFKTSNTYIEIVDSKEDIDKFDTQSMLQKSMN